MTSRRAGFESRTENNTAKVPQEVGIYPGPLRDLVAKLEKIARDRDFAQA